MSPLSLASTARERGIDLLALTDHNSARNAPAFAAACKRVGIMALYGTETTSREEVHVLSLFADVEDAVDWSAWIYERLPDFRHDPERFGDQVVVDVDENILDFEERYLIPAIDASIDEIAAETHRRGGLFIPAHIDRSTNSMLSQLGFLPAGDYDAIEVTRWPPAADPGSTALVSDSDAHFVDDVARRSFTFPAEVRFGAPQHAIFDALAAAFRTGATEPSIAG